jgi:hypothetical protein
MSSLGPHDKEHDLCVVPVCQATMVALPQQQKFEICLKYTKAFQN